MRGAKQNDQKRAPIHHKQDCDHVPSSHFIFILLKWRRNHDVFFANGRHAASSYALLSKWPISMPLCSSASTQSNVPSSRMTRTNPESGLPFSPSAALPAGRTQCIFLSLPTPAKKGDTAAYRHPLNDAQRSVLVAIGAVDWSQGSEYFCDCTG